MILLQYLVLPSTYSDASRTYTTAVQPLTKEYTVQVPLSGLLCVSTVFSLVVPVKRDRDHEVD